MPGWDSNMILLLRSGMFALEGILASEKDRDVAR